MCEMRAANITVSLEHCLHVCAMDTSAADVAACKLKSPYVNHFLVPDATFTVLVQAWYMFEPTLDVDAWNQYLWKPVGAPLIVDATLGGTIQAAEYLTNKNNDLKNILSENAVLQTENMLLGAKGVEVTVNVGQRNTKGLSSGKDMTKIRHTTGIGPDIDQTYKMSGKLGWSMYWKRPCWNGTFKGDDTGFAKLAQKRKNPKHDHENHPFVIDMSFIIKKKQ